MNPAFALLFFALGAGLVGAALWPRVGVAYRLMRRFGRSDRVLCEDALKALVHARARGAVDLGPALGVPVARARQVAARLVADGLASIGPEETLQLSAAGRMRAVELVRAHRLWERYLADRTGISEAEWHEEAERQEHRLTRAETDALAERMGRPLLDPHGDPIPTADGDLPAMDGAPLSTMDAGCSGEIVHLEDEPAGTYERLLRAGLAPGQRFDLLSSGEHQVRMRVEGREATINGADADAVTVREMGEPVGVVATLEGIGPGQAARVRGLAPALRGPQRRRLLDLGFVPGTTVEAEMASAMGDPVAYRVRGALIALRREQAAQVLVEPA